ncbi:MAG: type II toxin-antitoxin system HicA family toxin [Bdellovibrionota bacterium]
MSGRDVRKLFEQAGWTMARQKGSHCQMKSPTGEMETIPMNRELKKGLERKLLKRLRDGKK